MEGRDVKGQYSDTMKELAARRFTVFLQMFLVAVDGGDRIVASRAREQILL
jgi:hypothetical protein